MLSIFLHKSHQPANNITAILKKPTEVINMKATGIVRRIDDLGRVVIPKEIRRTMRIREGDPLQTTLKSELDYLLALLRLADRLYIK